MNEPIYEIVVTELGEEIIRKTDLDGKTWTIPKDEGNPDYFEYLESLKPVEKPKSK